MIELEEAVARVLASLLTAQAERVDLGSAYGRILAERVVSKVALPSFDNSAVDGYAVRAADLQKASAGSPVSLCLIGRVAAGEVFNGEVTTGSCVRIFTGSPMPSGADAVAWQEDTREDIGRPGNIQFLDVVKPWENVRFQGEDIKQGTVLGEAGDTINVGKLSLLAATGVTQVLVGRQPITGLLATGSELIEAGQPLEPGKIYESNRPGLAALVANAGAIPKIFPLVKDAQAETRDALEKAFQECDIVVTSGGVSVGEMDFVKSAFQEMGGQLEFWKVSIRPGRPFVFGRRQGKFFFGLPGNPVSAFITFLLLVRPALLRWQGAKEVNLPAHRGTLTEPMSNAGDRRHFVRVIAEPTGEVRSAGAQSSHIFASLAVANGLVDVPPKTTLPIGSAVRVMRWE